MIKTIFYLEGKLFFRNKFKMILLGTTIIALIFGFIFTIDNQRRLLDNDTRNITSIYNSVITKQLEFTDAEGMEAPFNEFEQEIFEKLQAIEYSIHQYLTLINRGYISEAVTFRVQSLELIEKLKNQYGVELMKGNTLNKELIYFKSIEKLNIDFSFNNEGTTGMLYLLTICKVFFSYLGLIFILLMTYDFWGTTRDKKYNLLFMQPFSRKRIIFDKFLFQVLLLTTIFIVLEIIAFFIGSIFFGFGNIEYPIILSVENIPIIEISLLDYWIQSTFLGLLSMVFIVSLICLISSISSSVSTLISIVLMVFSIGFGLDKLIIKNNFYPTNIFNSSEFIQRNGTLFMGWSYIIASLLVCMLTVSLLHFAINKFTKL